MAKQTKLQSFIAEEVDKVRGIYLPVRAGIFERALVRKVKISKLHPNPEDEFCFPDIGPNEEIVSRYEKEFRQMLDDKYASRAMHLSASEPLEVQKIRPDGYMILNGHHRWAAAVRTGCTHQRIHILNLTQLKDILDILRRSTHDKRIVMDLDEVVLSPGPDGESEKPLRFPFRRTFKDPVRLGIPSLFSFCASRGYDVWLYSSGYRSVDYIRELLGLHRAPVTGIITETARKTPQQSKETEALMNAKYVRTIHVDNEAVLCVDNQTKEFREYPLNRTALWSAEVMDVMRKVSQDA